MAKGVMTQGQSDARKSVYPWFYTLQPGGSWLAWTGGRVTLRELVRCPNFNGITVLHGIKLHALAFEDPAAGEGNFPRWEASARWTTSFTTARRNFPLGFHGERPPWAPTEPKLERKMGRPNGSRTGE
jgi:hypothetical protein